ncbi:MAG TPA: proton-conducting transporter membrane subunit, partial [Alphaproteobacteria bacterium]|nr:proton-conducting transporter membrane subunit [Alphaproteobacteria bacterium]
DEQDMRKMGGIYKFIPLTYGLMWIGSLALAGIWPFAGYFSKDTIIESAYAAQTDFGQYAFVMGVAAAALTAFYSLRLLFMTFHGKPRMDEHTLKHVHESPGVMLIPLIVLGIGAFAAGFAFNNYFVGEHHVEFWGHALFVAKSHTAMEKAESIPEYIKLMPLAAAVIGGYIAWLFYIRRPDIAPALAKTHEGLYKFLLNKWYFDELYDFLFVRPAKRLGRFLWKFGDGRIIDGFGPDGVSSLVARLAARARQLQTGYLYHYAFAMLLGIAVMTTWYIVIMAKG